MDTITHFINGKFYDSEEDSGGDCGFINKSNRSRKLEVYNPKTGEQLAFVDLATEIEVNKAVEAATNVAAQWMDVPIQKRAQIVMNFLELIGQYHEKLALAVTLEHGKSVENAKAEIISGIEILKFAITSPNLLKTSIKEGDSGSMSSVLMKEPLGVIAGITESNFPVMSALCMFPVALVCGNTFILNPSPEGPRASIVIAKLLKKAGLPDGVFNVVQGNKTATDALVSNPQVKGICFTGLTKNANYVHETGSKRGKRLQTVGRARNHMVVLPDTDVEHTIDTLMQNAFINVGERGMAISSVIFVGGIGKHIIPVLHNRIIGLMQNDCCSEEGDMAPISSPLAMHNMVRYIEQGVSKDGAKLLVDGRNFKHSQYPKGFWLGPTLFDEVDTNMTIYKDEIFGPVLSCMHVETMEEAIRITNEHESTNGVCCFTTSAENARQFADAIEVGMVGINATIQEPMAWRGFGGWKRGLLGDMHAYGEESLRFFTRQKTVAQLRTDKIAKGASFFTGS